MKELTKEMFAMLNTTAVFNFKRAQAMLDGINMVLGTEYDWLNKRVIFYDDNSHAHDAWACAE